MHKYPALHNAMWPGLVGKGPDSEPPIDLDTMLEPHGRGEVGGVKFDGVDLFLFDPHVSIDSIRRRSEAPGRPGRREESRRRIARGAGLAADRRRLGDGQRGGAQELRHAGPQGLRDREEAQGSRHPQIRRRPDRLGREPERLGDGSGRQPEEDRRDVPPGVRRRRRLRRAPRRRRRDLLGRHAQLEAQRRAARAGEPAARRSASRPTWPTRCSSRSATTRPRIASCRKTTTGRDRETLDEALEDDDARAAAVDDRFPRRAERRDGQRLGLARQDRPALPAERSQRQARHRAPRRLLAARRRGQGRRERSSTSAGTAACSPTRR